MKKIISVIFVSFVFAVLMFSANAYASEPERAPDILADVLGSEEFQLSLLIENNESKTNIVFYKKDDKVAMDFDIPLANTSFNIMMRCVVYGDCCYLYLPKFPLFYIKTDGDVIDESVDTSMLNYMGSEERVVDGKTYTIEKYEYDGNIVCYGIENNEIVFVESYTEDYYNIMYINSISYSVNNFVFIRPFWAIDLSLFLDY